MKTAAVSELKAFLSKYLSNVKAGEEVVVTDRGRPIAKIVPMKRVETDMPPHLLTLERAGQEAGWRASAKPVCRRASGVWRVQRTEKGARSRRF